MKSQPPKTDLIKTFFDEFLIKLATMQRADSREERAILETASVINFLSSSEVEDILNKPDNNSIPLDAQVRRRTVSVEITDFDIATIEALHDLLFDKHGYELNHTTLCNARKLTHKMYEAFKSA